jgi:hypothetical protein
LNQRDGNTKETIIDTTDLEKVLNHKYKWGSAYMKNADSYYAISTIYLGTFDGKPKYTTITLNNFLMDCPNNGRNADHKNSDTLNNRRNNLRIADDKDNNTNRKSKNKNNKSGYRNVYWSTNDQKWCVRLQIEKQNTLLGMFDNVHEAGSFAKEMRKKYYKDFRGKD